MAHIWARTGNGEWGIAEASEQAYRLTGEEGRPLRRCGNGDTGRWPLLVRVPGSEAWALMAGTGATLVRVNGFPLQALGVRVLADRDEIRVADLPRLYFSTERLARVVPFPGTDKPVKCARCKRVIEPGAPAVRCPQCGVWYHQSDEWPGWTYAPVCAVCGQPTALDEATYRWTPEEWES